MPWRVKHERLHIRAILISRYLPGLFSQYIYWLDEEKQNSSTEKQQARCTPHIRRHATAHFFKWIFSHEKFETELDLGRQI